jgi:CubicO group peptidase (beta-lactamase class C family)
MKDILRRFGWTIVLLGLMIGLLPVPASELPPKSIAETLKPFVESKGIAGAVTLVADKNKVLGVEAVGAADIAANRPMLVDAIFWIASMSKPITAAALMILVDEGKVKLDDPVEKYIPEFKGIRVMTPGGKDGEKSKHPLTVREVLSHTSGLDFRYTEEEPNDRCIAAQGRGVELHEGAASVSAGDRLQILERRHQHGGAHHRDCQRHVL